MATIGELIEALKGYGPDADTIRPEDSDGNGLLEPYADDIPTSVKEKIGEYLHQRTGGPSTDNALENVNYWPVEDTEGVSDYSLIDANGKPVGPTKTATGEDSYGYTKSFETALNEAISVFESEGHFFGGGVDEDTPVSDILDKSSQEDGHDILNRFAGAPFTGEETAATHGSEPSETKTVMSEAHPETATSSALRNNRWSRGYYPELDTTFGLQNANTPMFQELAGDVKNTRRRYTSDRPFVDSSYINKDYSEEMTKASEPWPETDPLLGIFIDEPLAEPWDSIPYSDTEGKVAYIAKLMDKMRELNTDHPDWYYVGKQSFVAAFIIKLVLEVIGIALVALAEAITKPKSGKGPDNTVEPSPVPKADTPPWDLAYGSRIGRKKNSAAAPPADGGGLLGALLDALPIGDELDFETMMGFLGIPIPYAAMDALSEESDFWGTFIKTTIDGLGNMIGTDATMVVFWGPIIRHFGVLLTDLDKLWPMPKIGDANSIIPGASLLFALDAFLAALRDSSVLRLIRALVSVGDAWFASAGSFSPNNFQAGTDYRGNWDIHPRYRGFRSRTRVADPTGNGSWKWKIAQSVNQLPSLYLLPAAFQNSVQRFGDATGEAEGESNRPTGLLGNIYLNYPLHEKLLNSSPAALQANAMHAAVHQKIGTPAISTNKRFSPGEVNFMEGLLEAEYMPFYFQDLRTNEIIAFHAFLSSLSDSFSPSYNASSGFGRIEDVQIYQKTSRSISLTFTLAAMQKADMNEMYIKLNKLVTMVYPQWSRGTALSCEMDDLTPNYIQPFSQIPTATPLVRLRVGDIIQSNYSKFNLTRLFGTSWAGTDADGNATGFGTGDNPDGAFKTAAINEAGKHCKLLPVSDAQGTIDTAEAQGFPIGSLVYVVAPMATANIGPGHLISNRFAATIVSYEPHPRFANDGETSGANDVLVNLESAQDLRRTTHAGENGWVENQYSKEHKDVQVLYSHLITDEAAFGRSVTNSTTWPLVIGKNEEVKKQIDDFNASGDNTTDGDPAKIAKLMFAKDNPLFQAFESSMGRGLAGVITSLDVGYKLNEAPWEIDPGSRGPTMIEISVGFTPIHDIPPGLDADGYNRAPVYKMASSGDIAGDAWDGGAENGFTDRRGHEDLNEEGLMESEVANSDRPTE